MSWYDRQASEIDDVYRRKYCVFYQKDPARSYDTTEAVRLHKVQPQAATLEQEHAEEQCGSLQSGDPDKTAGEYTHTLQNSFLSHQVEKSYSADVAGAAQQKPDTAEANESPHGQTIARPSSAVEESYNPYFRKYDIFYQGEDVVNNQLRSEIEKKKKEWEEQRLAAEDKDTFRRKYEKFYLDQEYPGLSATALFRKHNESSIGFIDRSLRESAGDRPRSSREPKELAGFESYASRVSFRKRK